MDNSGFGNAPACDRLAVAAPEARSAPTLLTGTVGPGAAAIGAAILPLHLNYSPTHELLIGH